MKFNYNLEDDILMVELNNKPIDYAEQSGNLIVHFSPQKQAVLLEILKASSFLKDASKSLPKKLKSKVFELA